MPNQPKVPVVHKIIHTIITAVTLAFMFLMPSFGFTLAGSYECKSMYDLFKMQDQVSFVIFVITLAVFVFSVVLLWVNKPGVALACHIGSFVLLAASSFLCCLFLSQPQNAYKYYILYPYIVIAALPFIQIALYVLTLVSSSGGSSAPVAVTVPPTAPAPQFVPIAPTSPADAPAPADEVEIQVTETNSVPVEPVAPVVPDTQYSPESDGYVSPFVPTEQVAEPAATATEAAVATMEAPVTAEEAPAPEMSSVYDSALDVAPVPETAPAYGESALNNPAEMTSVYDSPEAAPASEAVYESAVADSAFYGGEADAPVEDNPYSDLTMGNPDVVYDKAGDPTVVADAPADTAEETVAANDADQAAVAAMYEQAMTDYATAPVSAVPAEESKPTETALPHVSDLRPMYETAPVEKHELTEDEEMHIHEQIGVATKRFEAGEISEEEYNETINALREQLS